MNENPDCELTNETARLLSELELALDHYSSMRNIDRHRKLLHDLEILGGPCLRTRSLRAQIRSLEQRLGDARAAPSALPGAPLLSA